MDKEEKKLLTQIKFKMSFRWPSDPLEIISAITLDHNSAPYIHFSKPDIEKYVNREVSEENTLQ